MRVILRMVRKDLLRKLRSPLGLVVVLLFPVAFSAIIALSFGGGGGVPRAKILVDNRDDGFFGNALISALGSNQAAEFFDVENVGEPGERLIADGKGSALLRIPQNFSRDLIDGTPTTLELIRNPAQGIMPEVAEQVAGVLAEVLSAGSQVLREPLRTLAPFTKTDKLRITDETVAAVSVAIKGSIDGAVEFLDPPVIDFESVDLGAEPAAAGSGSNGYFSVFLFVFPGVSVWSLFLAGDIAMRDILTEYEAGTLRRQLQGPIGSGTLIAAKAAFTMVTCLIALAILAATAAVVADRAVDPAGFVLLSLALILAITGAGAAIYGAAGRQRRGTTIASVLYLVLAFAGGSFVDVNSMPAAIRALSPVSPFYWGTQGYKALLDGGGVRDVAGAAAVLAALGVVLGVVGTSWMNRRLLRGGAA